MERLEDARITLLVDGVERPYREEDGLVEGGLTDRNEVILNVELPEEFWMVGLMVDGKKNVSALRNRANGDTDFVLHQVKIPVKLADTERYAGQYHTEYSQNNIRVLTFEEDDSVELWEITLLSHEGIFYLRQQCTFEAQLFQNGGVIVTDNQNLNNWPGMMTIIKGQLGEDAYDLPVFSSATAHSNGTQPEEFGPRHGRVDWYNDANGFGAVRTDAGVMRVHRIGIKTSGFPELRSGQIVTWDNLVEPQQTSKRQTTFSGEIRGVSVVG